MKVLIKWIKKKLGIDSLEKRVAICEYDLLPCMGVDYDFRDYTSIVILRGKKVIVNRTFPPGTYLDVIEKEVKALSQEYRTRHDRQFFDKPMGFSRIL